MDDITMYGDGKLGALLCILIEDRYISTLNYPEYWQSTNITTFDHGYTDSKSVILIYEFVKTKESLPLFIFKDCVKLNVCFGGALC